MVELLDGPGAGEVFFVRRAPMLLRVVRGPRGRWDCLNELDDVATEKETLSVYRMKPGTFLAFHVKCQKRSESGFFQGGKYEFVEVDAESLRDNDAWEIWCKLFLREMELAV